MLSSRTVNKNESIETHKSSCMDHHFPGTRVSGMGYQEEKMNLLTSVRMIIFVLWAAGFATVVVSLCLVILTGMLPINEVGIRLLIIDVAAVLVGLKCVGGVTVEIAGGENDLR